MEKLAARGNNFAGLVLQYRQLTKLKSTYLDALPREVNPDTGRIHTRYNQVVAATGRLSSSDPNLQNIPIRTEMGRKVRDAFVPEPGWSMLAADYSQIELRIMAHLSADKGLLKAFELEQDVHRATAAEVFDTTPWWTISADTVRARVAAAVRAFDGGDRGTAGVARATQVGGCWSFFSPAFAAGTGSRQ